MNVLPYLCCLISVSVAAQQRIYVQPMASGQPNGSSWANAYTSLQPALAAAKLGDEIWVAEGTYKPTSNNDRTKYFEIKSGVRVYGGFAGTETDLAQRNWAEHPTILSGDIGQPNDSTDNSYSVTYMFRPNENTLMDGFIVERGTATYTGAIYNLSSLVSGGGLYIMAENPGAVAYPTIRNCTFRHNTALQFGGAICINGDYGGSVGPAILSCRFEYNSSTHNSGTAIHRVGGSTIPRPQDIEDCVFYRNYSNPSFIPTSDGALSIHDRETVDTFRVLRCDFIENKSDPTSIVFADVSPTGALWEVKFCKFIDNIKFDNIWIRDLDYQGYIQHLEISDCYFKHHQRNLVRTPIKNVFGSVNGEFRFLRNTFAPTSTAYLDVFLYAEGNIRLEDLNITGVHGAKLALTAPYKLMANQVHFSACKNAAMQLTSYEVEANQVSVTKCDRANFGVSGDIGRLNQVILANNAEVFNTQGALVLERTMLQTEIKNLTVNNSVLEGTELLTNFIVRPPSTDSIPNSGNITFNNSIISAKRLFSTRRADTTLLNVQFNHCLLNTDSLCMLYPSINCGLGNQYGLDPLFRDTANGNFSLLPCSPAINAGDNSVITAGALDYIGRPRIQGRAVDMGPLESAPLSAQSLAPLADPTCGPNGIINVQTADACPPIQYFWAGASGTGNSLSGLLPGEYALTIMDAKGDTVMTSVTVPTLPPPNLSIATTPVLCGGTIGGTAAPSMPDAKPPLTYLWEGGSTDSLRSNLAYGVYTVTVTDARGCTAWATTTVGQVGKLGLVFDTQPPTCSDVADGSIALIPTDGVPPHLFAWDDVPTTDSLRIGVLANVYQGNIVDALGCKLFFVLPLQGPAAITAIDSVTHASGANIPDGAIELLPMGGTGSITVQWSNGQTGTSIKDLEPGIYTATLTDANGCTAELEYEVEWVVGTDEEPKLGQFRQWPNPTNHIFWIQPPAQLPLPWVFRLSDAQGRSVRTLVREDAGVFQVEVGDLPAGMYYWEGGKVVVE